MAPATQAASKFTVANPLDSESYQAGQFDKANATIVSVLAYPHRGKESKDNKYYGFIGVRFLPDPDSGYEEFTRSYLSFYLNNAVPSKDGTTPAGGTDEDYADLNVGKGNLDPHKGFFSCLDESRKTDRHVIPDHPNVGPYVLGKMIKDGAGEQFFEALLDADTKGMLDKSGLPRLDFCVGTRCRLDLVPQKRQPKNRKEGDREQMVLVPTEIISVGEKIAGKPSGASAGTGAGKSTTNGAVGEAVSAAILDYLAKNGGSAKKGILLTKIPTQLSKEGYDKANIMAWIGESDPDDRTIAVNLVGIDGTVYDPDTATLSLEQ